MYRNDPNVISSEMRYPTETSKKKKRFVKFICEACSKPSEKVYQADRWSALCTSCAKGAFTTAQFIERAKQVHGDTYDYSKTVYVNKRTSVTIGCAIHGDFSQRGQDHMDGRGCRKCADAQRALDLAVPAHEWKERISAYPRISFKDEKQLGFAKDFVDFVCEVHGEYSARLQSFIGTIHGCPQCGSATRQRQSVRPQLVGTEAQVYFAYLPSIGAYKLGVTTNLPARLKSLGDAQALLSVQLEYTEALDAEYELHELLSYDAFKSPERMAIGNGYTELYCNNHVSYILRALAERSATESYLNGESPTSNDEDNPVAKIAGESQQEQL